MYDIIRSKNGTIITPYDKRQSKLLERNTSLYDNVYHKSIEITGFRIEPYNGDSAFITHKQEKSLLLGQFPNYKLSDMKSSKPKRMFNEFELIKEINLTDVQGDIVSEIVTSKKVFNEWFINLQTAGGKTLIGVYLSSHFNYKTWIFCFSSDILSQWIDTYKDKTTKDEESILMVSSNKTIKKMIEHPEEYEKYDVFLSTSGLLMSYLKRTDYSNLEVLFDKLGIGMLIFDEAHRNMSNIVKINALSNISKTLYLSADFAQGDYKKENLYYRIFSKTMIVRPPAERTFKYTKIIVVDFDSKPNQIESLGIYNRYGFSAELYMQYEIDKGMIYSVIEYIMTQIDNTEDNHRTLILISNVEHVDLVTEYLREHFPTKSIGRYHGSVPAEEKKLTKDSASVIVSTYKSFSTGLDVEDIKYVITTNQSNKVEDNQAAGRSRPLKDGTDAVYFILIDSGFSYCRKKLRTRLNYLKDTKLKENPYIIHYTNK